MTVRLKRDSFSSYKVGGSPIEINPSARWYTALNGINSYFESSVMTFTGDFEIEFGGLYWKGYSGTSEQCMTYCYNGGMSLIVARQDAAASPNSILFRSVGASDLNFTNVLAGSENTGLESIKRVGLVVTVTTNGVEHSQTLNATSSFSINLWGSRSSYSYFDGTFYDLKIWQDGDKDTGTLIFDVPLDEPYDTGLVYKNYAGDDLQGISIQEADVTKEL